MKKINLILTGALFASALGAASYDTKAGDIDVKVFSEAAMATSNPWGIEDKATPKGPNSDKLNALSVGARADFMSKSFMIPELSMGASFVVAMPVVSSEDFSAGAFDQANMDKNGKSEGFFALNELFFKFTEDNYILKVLMQEIKTPMIDKGESEFLPNSFNAVMMDIYPGKVKVQAGYVMAMSGADKHYDNEIRQEREQFHSMSKALTGNDNADDAGVWMVGAVYNPKNEPVRARAYYYMMQDFEISANKDESLTNMYLDFRYSTLDYKAIYKINSKGDRYLDKPRRPKLQAQAQYFTGDYTQASGYSVFGFKVGYVTQRNSPYRFTYAMSTVGGDGDGVTYSFGGKPEYTKMEEFDLASVSAAKSAMRVGVDYYYKRGTAFELAFATFAGDDKNGNAYGTNKYVESGNITDILVTHRLNEKIKIKGAFEYQMLDGTGTHDPDDTLILKALATYTF